MAQLLVFEGPDRGRTFDLVDREVLGREEEASIHLSDRRILPRQAIIERDGDGWRLVNLGRPEDVLVNHEHAREKALQHGDMIAIADTLILFTDEVEVPATPGVLDSVSESSMDVPGRAGEVSARIRFRQKVPTDASALVQSFGRGGTDRRLETLYKVNTAIGAILDLDLLLTRILEILRQVFPIDRGTILLVDDERQCLVTRASGVWTGGGERVMTPGVAEGPGAGPRISRTILKEVYRTREALVSTDAAADERFKMQQSIAEIGIRAAMCAPLVFKGEFLGVIHVDSTSRSEVFAGEDLELLSAIATQAAVVIASARTYQKRQEYAKKLVSLGEASRRVSGYLQREHIIREVVRHACEILHCTRASIVLLDPQTGELSLPYAVGMARDGFRDLQMEDDQGYSEKVIASGQTMLVSDVREISFDAPLDMVPRYRSDSFLIVPIPSKVEGKEEREVRVIGALNVTEKINGGVFTPEDKEILSILAVQTGIALANANLYEQATIDSLTRVFARHFFFYRIEQEVVRARNGTRPLALAIFDLDLFKEVNDTYGHPVGDRLLKETAQILMANLRDDAIVARYGGDEFTVLFPGAELDVAVGVVERVRATIEVHPFRFCDPPHRQTVSIGVASLQDGDDAARLIEKADRALYQSKGEGRNAVRAHA